MRQYRDSGIEWIGKIPETWEVTAIKRLFFLYAGATPKSDEPENWDGDIPWITPADYQTEDRYISGGKRSISQKGMDSCATTMLPVNSIIFSKRAPIGLVVINTNPLCTNQGCIGCVPKDSIVSKYFYFAMSVFTEQFELYGAGTTFKEISATNFGNFIIVAPPISDQQRIADYLDLKCGEIDSLIGLQEQMIEKLKAYKQSVITEAVTKGLDPNVKFVPSGIDWIGEIPERWKVYALKWLMDLYAGATPKSDDSSLWDGEISWITPADYKTEDIYVSGGRRNISQKGLESCATTVLPKGSVVFSKRAPIGLVAINDRPLCTNQGCIGCIVNSSRAFNKFFYYTLSVYKEQFELYGFGTTFKEISATKFANFMVPVPPLSEQHSIATYLDSK